LLLEARGVLASHLQQRETWQGAIDHAVQNAFAAANSTEQGELFEARATFVTLWRRDNGELRGCRGECAAHQPLIAAVANMALAAATDDPRFVSVTAAELPLLRVEVSVLTPLAEVEPQQVRVGIDGIMVVHGQARGLLLPQVAVEHAMTREQFLEAVCWKAGLSQDAWRAPGTHLWAFQTQCWEEA
jgi:AmmeMemoRadiSam system protein A